MASCHSSSNPKPERKIIEKRRRDHMKTLYSKLYSLLPNHGTKEAVVPLIDQIEEAEKHIKSYQFKLEKLKEKRETILGRKRSHACTSSTEPCQGSKSPQIEIRQMGAALDLVLVCGQDDHFIFHEIIRIIAEEGAEVVHASYSVHGSTVLHVVHAKTGKFEPSCAAERVSSILKEFVNGSTSEVESQPESREIEIQPDIWELEIPQSIANYGELILRANPIG